MPHRIQKIILKNLLLQKELRFSEMNSEGISNDHFSFHVKRLVSEGIVLKEGGLYRLTPEGKEYANRFDIDGEEVALQKQAKLGILVVGKDEKGRYLVQQRLKEPYYGLYGFVSGKIRWGEAIHEAAQRELSEEAGLMAEGLVLKGIEHKIDYSPEGKLLEDKYFYITLATGLSGEFQESFDAGKNYWLYKQEIAALPDLFPDVPKIIAAVEQDDLVFFEDKYKVSRY